MLEDLILNDNEKICHMGGLYTLIWNNHDNNLLGLVF